VQPSGAQAPALGVDQGHLQFVRDAMAAVVASGTAAENGAANLSFGSVRMAGKTGTAQSHSYAGGRGQHGATGRWVDRDHAWFIAFAPYDDPRYAMSVLVEHGGMGAEAAAPKAREIMRVALLKDPQVRARIVQPAPVAASPA
jgi:penicillin-binding protein 2